MDADAQQDGREKRPLRVGCSEDGAALVMVIVVLVPLTLLVGYFTTTMARRSDRMESEVALEQALVTAEAGIDIALYLAATSGLNHQQTYGGTLVSGARWQVEATLLSLDGADNDGDSLVDEADEDVFQVISTGTAQGETRRLAAYLGRNPSSVLSLGGAFTSFDPTVDYVFGGSAVVDGNNHDLSGAPADPADSKSAMAIVTPHTLPQLTSTLDATELSQVEGIGGTGDVRVAPTFDLAGLVNIVRNQASNVLTSDTYSGGVWGTPANPQITLREGDLKLAGITEGHGILVITGNLSYAGTVDWNGLMIVLGEINKGVGTSLVRGGLVIGPTSDRVELKGTFDLQYSQDALDTAMDLTRTYTVFNGWQELSRTP